MKYKTATNGIESTDCMSEKHHYKNRRALHCEMKNGDSKQKFQHGCIACFFVCLFVYIFYSFSAFLYNCSPELKVDKLYSIRNCLNIGLQPLEL